MSNDCCTYGCIGTGKDCPTRTTHQAHVADWANAFPEFYQNGHVAMQVDEPSLRETMLAFFADGWRYMLTGAALASAGGCIGLTIYFK